LVLQNLQVTKPSFNPSGISSWPWQLGHSILVTVIVDPLYLFVLILLKTTT